MNSAVWWLMFKGIQHLLDRDQPPAAVCLNGDSQPVCKGCFFLFLFMFPHSETQNTLAQSQWQQLSECSVMNLSLAQRLSAALRFAPFSKRDSCTTCVWNNSRRRVALIFISHPIGKVRHPQQPGIDLSMITQQDLHSHYRTPRPAKQQSSIQCRQAASCLKYNNQKCTF